MKTAKHRGEDLAVFEQFSDRYLPCHSGLVILGRGLARSRIVCRGTERRDDDVNSRFRLELYPFHPEDAPIDFENWPDGPASACNFHAFKHFLHFPWTAGVLQTDPVPRFP